MGNFLRIVNGQPRSFAESSTLPIYDERLTVVVSGASGSNQVNGPVTAGTAITLPLSQTYTAKELEVDFNGQLIKPVFDYNYVGGAPHSQIIMTFDLLAGDTLDFRVARGP